MNTLKQMEGGFMSEEQTSTDSNISIEAMDVSDQSVTISSAEVWRRNLSSMAYIAASTFLAYALIASFVLIAD